MEFEYNDRKFGEKSLQDPSTDEEIVAALNHDIKSSEWVLAALHRQWYESIFWTLGEQYMEWNQRTRRFQVRPARWYIPRSVTNLILPKVESGIAMFLDALPKPKAVSTTKEDSDRAAAEVANGVLKYRDQESQFDRKRREAAAWTVVTGTCYLQTLLDTANAEKIRIPRFEHTAEPVLGPDGQPVLGPDGQPVMEQKERKVIDPETGDQAYDEVVMADEGVEVRSPFEIIPDWSARYPWEFRRYTHFRAQTRDWIGRTFGADAKAKVKSDKGMGILGYYQLKVLDIITRSSATGRLGLPTAYGGSAADWRFMEDSAVVISRYQLPTNEHQDGRLMITAGNVVLYNETYPYNGKLNLYTLRWSVLPGSIFGFGMPRNLIGPQKRLNGIDTQDDLIRKTMGNPQWLVAKGSQFAASLGTSEPGHVNTYRFRANSPKPERLPAMASHPYNAEQRRAILTDMEEISGIRHVLAGQNPPGVEAGVSLELLTEQAGKRFQPTIEDNREELKRLYMHRLEIAQGAPAWSVAERAVPIVGEDGERDVRKYLAADFKGNLTMEIEAVPITASSSALRKQRAVEAVGLGLVDLTNSQHRDKMRQLMSLSEFDDPQSLDYRRAQMENEIIESGGTVRRGPYDNDEIHFEQHMKLAKSRRWDKLPESIKQELQRHVDEEHVPRLTPTPSTEETGASTPTPGASAPRPRTTPAAEAPG